MSDRNLKNERRSARRIPVYLGAVLYHKTLMLPECQICDLSHAGAFIDTGGHFLPDQAWVDLAFNASLISDAPQRFTAQVVRCTEEGVGVRLQLTDNLSMRKLIETLYAA